MGKSKIEWTEVTWNPVTGCSKVTAGCKNCYAEREWPRLAGNPLTVYHGREFGDVACHPKRLTQPLHWQKPRMVFVNSMSDLFHEMVPDHFIDQIFAVMAMSPKHTFQILTKRPERMLRYISGADKFDIAGCAANLCEDADNVFDFVHGVSWPLTNVWLGVSPCQEYDVWMIEKLLETPAALRFISVEPMIGPIDLELYLDCGHESGGPQGWISEPSLDWVILGGESGPNARPMSPVWARGVRDDCKAAGVPFFFKQCGEFIEDHPGTMVRVGRKKAGSLLDGVSHKEMPRV